MIHVNSTECNYVALPIDICHITNRAAVQILITAVNKCDTSQSNHRWRKKAKIVENANCFTLSVVQVIERRHRNSTKFIRLASCTNNAQVLAYFSNTPITGTRHERNEMLPCVLQNKWSYFVETAQELMFPYTKNFLPS
jgi:hypothetical protein